MAVVWKSIFDHTPSVFALKFLMGGGPGKGGQNGCQLMGNCKGQVPCGFRLKQGISQTKENELTRTGLESQGKFCGG